jgi:excisionase family DNA binding protein
VPEPLVSITLNGLEAVIERLVEQKLAAVLADREPDEWLDSAQAAEYLRVSTARIHDLVCERKLPRHGPKGSKLRFRRSELDAYADGRRS